METGHRKIVETVFKRAGFLDALAQAPADKRELVDTVDTSRSTVNRAVCELEQWGLVTYDSGAYRLTVCGRLLWEQYVQFERNTAAVSAASTLLRRLSTTAPLEPAFLRGAEVVTAEYPQSHLPVTALSEIIAEASHLRGIAKAHAAPKAVDALREAIETDADAELVICEDVYSQLRTVYDWLSDAIAEGTLRPYLVTELPYTLLTAVHDERKRSCLVVYDEGLIEGILVNDTQAAFNWATDIFESYRQDADPVPELDTG